MAYYYIIINQIVSSQPLGFLILRSLNAIFSAFHAEIILAFAA
jgi:hypothetical protein